MHYANHYLNRIQIWLLIIFFKSNKRQKIKQVIIIYLSVQLCYVNCEMFSVINADKHVIMDPDLAVTELVIFAGFSFVIIVFHLSTKERHMCFDISEVCAPPPLLHDPSSRIHVQLHHVEHPGVLLCTSDELFQVNMTCGSKKSKKD